MDFIIDNWYLILALFAVVAFVVFICVKFFNMPTQKQLDAFKEWLKYAVLVAEKEFGGSGTGSIKLRFVYDMAIQKFSWVAKVISFEQFESFVSEALKWLEKQLSSNETVKTLVKGE